MSGPTRATRSTTASARASPTRCRASRSAQIDQVSSIAQTVYNYDTLGLIQNAVEQDEKYIAKID